MNGFVSLEAGEETFRETLSARVNVSSAINGRISTHTFGLALAGVIHQGPFQIQVIQRQWNLVPRSAGPSRASLSRPARLFLVLCREKHKAAPASERMLVLFTKLGWEWDDG